MKHKAIRVDNLMYKGCEPHWQCTLCGNAVPFHCYTGSARKPTNLFVGAVRTPVKEKYRHLVAKERKEREK